MPKSYRKTIRIVSSSVKNRKKCAYFGTCRDAYVTRAIRWIADTAILPPEQDTAPPVAAIPAFCGPAENWLQWNFQRFRADVPRSGETPCVPGNILRIDRCRI